MTAPEATRPRALLTGASGFIASRLARKLVALGWEVHAIARSDAAAAGVAEAAGTGVQVHRVDGTTERMIEVMRAAQPGTVFHLASLFLAQHQPRDIVALVESNVLLGAQLAEAMVQCGVRHLVNTGTSWQHHEDAAYQPVNLYASTKQAFEDVLAYYTTAQGLRVTTLVLFDTYGAGDPRAKLIHLLRRTAREGTALDMSPGEQEIDLVHVDDVVRAYVRAAELLPQQAAPHERFGVSSGRPLPLRELVRVFQQATGSTLQIRWGARPYRPREVMRAWSTYRTLPGWQPEIPLEIGLASE